MSGQNKKAMRKSLPNKPHSPQKRLTEKLNLFDSTTPKRVLSSKKMHENLLNIIGTGEENAKHLCELMRLTGLESREVRKQIERLRRSGSVIVSSPKGYFKPLKNEEIIRYIKQEERRAKSIFQTLKAAKKFLKGRDK